MPMRAPGRCTPRPAAAQKISNGVALTIEELSREPQQGLVHVAVGAAHRPSRGPVQAGPPSSAWCWQQAGVGRALRRPAGASRIARRPAATDPAWACGSACGACTHRPPAPCPHCRSTYRTACPPC
jgi:hypothetical protein